MNRLFINAVLVLEDRLLENAWLLTNEKTIIDFGTGRTPESDDETKVEDVKGCFLSPGFIDTHVHGGGGADFLDGNEEAFITALQTHYHGGTTTILPTFSSASKDDIFTGINVFNSLKQKEANLQGIPHLAGLHLEGPYFSLAQCGAQDTDYIRNPDPKEYEEILNATPYIRKWSVACELPGALEFGTILREREICASIGHSNATAEQAIIAVKEYGYNCITHLYSSCSYLHRNGPYREGGVVEAAFLLKDLMVEVIGDGRHLPPLFLKLIWQIKGTEKICLITDCIRPGAHPYVDGQIDYSDKEKKHPIILENGVAIVQDRTCFAGSISTMSNVVKVMTQDVGIPLFEVVRMASLNPAIMLGIADKVGSIQQGKRADLVVLNRDLSVQGVFRSSCSC